MRIMFVGDSITIGGAGEHTWRYRMWQHLRRSPGGPYEITGPRSELYDPGVGAPVSHDYADPAFPAATSPAGARAGCTWRPSSGRRSPVAGPDCCSSHSA